MSWLAGAGCEDVYPGPRILLTLSVLRSPSVFWIGHSRSEKLMKRWKGKELSPLLPKSLSPSLSVSELQAPPLCRRDNSYSPYFSETIWGSNSNGILVSLLGPSLFPPSTFCGNWGAVPHQSSLTSHPSSPLTVSLQVCNGSVCLLPLGKEKYRPEALRVDSVGS